MCQCAWQPFLLRSEGTDFANEHHCCLNELHTCCLAVHKAAPTSGWQSFAQILILGNIQADWHGRVCYSKPHPGGVLSLFGHLKGVMTTS